MLLAGGIIVEPQLICSALINNQFSDMWLYWSAAIGSAFSISFFAHLWQKVPVKTENEFLFFRFSGLGAKILHQFRSLYLGLLIIPFIISFSLLAFSKIVGSILGIEIHITIIIVSILLLFLTFFNSLKVRLRMDFVLFVIFIILFCVLLFSLYNATGGLNKLSKIINSSKINFNILPTFGSKAFNAFIVYIAVQWWSASLLDYPDMNGQKLMATNNSKDLVKSIFLPSFSILIFRMLLFTLPFIAVFYGFTNGCNDSELAITYLFIKVLPSWMMILILILFMIPFISVVQNMQNWGGSLLVENFYKHFINQNADENKLKKTGLFAMVYIIIASAVISFHADSLVGITKYLFTITAGVGPVFMLRWYWWRINAWSQLSAMIACLFFPLILDWLVANNNFIYLLIMKLETFLNLDYYPLKIIILTISVCCVWISITFLTPPTDEKILRNFARTIKPGGFWKDFDNHGKSFSKTRVLAWLIQTINCYLVYFMFWNFLVGNYLYFTLIILIFSGCFFLSYRLIQKANSKYELEITK